MTHDDIPKPDMRDVYDHYGLRIVGGDRGGWRKAECPLPEHEDMDPSATINEDRWRCHACNEGGDAIDIIMRRDRAGWAAARAVAQSLVEGSGGAVRAAPRASSHVPGRSRRDGRSGAFVPPWLRL